MDDAQIWDRLMAVVAGVQARGLSDEVATLAPLVDLAQEPRLRGELSRLLGFYFLRQQQHAQAVPHHQRAVALLPDRPDAAYNLVYSLFSLGRLDEAAAQAQQALQAHGDDFSWRNMLATVAAAQGRTDEARLHGTQALRLKDALTAGQGPAVDLAACPLPPFDAQRPAQQVISFSLYGRGARYLQGAVWNAEAAAYLYPGWTCRFHVDASVPADTLAALRARGAQVRTMPADVPAARWGTLWRFLVADDPAVARYLVRDADSVLNLREAVAVQAWLDSGHHFHVMRDSPDHSELVLAGMWGGVRGALPPVQALARQHLAQTDHVPNRTADQEFLRLALWPTIRASVLVHDSQFDFAPRQDFPPLARLPAGHHVGGDARALLQRPDTEGATPPPPGGTPGTRPPG